MEQPALTRPPLDVESAERCLRRGRRAQLFGHIGEQVVRGKGGEGAHSCSGRLGLGRRRRKPPPSARPQCGERPPPAAPGAGGNVSGMVVVDAGFVPHIELPTDRRPDMVS